MSGPRAKPISFDHLSPVDFEELTFDLLQELGYEDLSWRKGTPKPASPADGGRDIECTLERTTPDGRKYQERWFVECKHYGTGVPSSALSDILGSAAAGRPDHVLIVCSGYLSNAAKDYCEDYLRNNRPPFKWTVWEQPTLQKLLRSKSRLLIKYRLAFDMLFMEQLHPLHAYYIRDPRANTMDHLWKVLERLPADRREECMSNAYFMVVNPRFRRPRHARETIGELMVDRVDYASFKERCQELSIGGVFLVRAIISFCLDWLFSHADETRQDFVRGNLAGFNAYARERLEGEALDDTERKQLTKMIEDNEEAIAGLPARQVRARETYEYFCENVVAELLVEEVALPRSEEELPWVD